MRIWYNSGHATGRPQPAQRQAIIAQLSDQLAQAEQQRQAQAAQLQQQAATLNARQQRIEQLLELIALRRRKRFAPSRDRVPDTQLALFDEGEFEALIAELEEELEQQRAPAAAPREDAAKRQPVRRPLPAHLPRIERMIDLPDEEQAAMGDDWRLIGYETSEQRRADWSPGRI